MIPATSVFIEGDEMLGFILYGLWLTPSAYSSMPRYEAQGATVRTSRLEGDCWTIGILEVGFETGDHYWAAIGELDGVLDAILKNGAEVAWLGSEGLPFADPPDLFTVEWMEGGVLAARSADGVSLSGIASGGFTPLSNAQMGALERIARAVCGPSVDGADCPLPTLD